MLCCTMLCYAMLCYAVLYYAMLSYAMLYYALNSLTFTAVLATIVHYPLSIAIVGTNFIRIEMTGINFVFAPPVYMKCTKMCCPKIISFIIVS